MKYPRIAEDKSQLEAFKNETDAKLADSLSCLVIEVSSSKILAKDVNRILDNAAPEGKGLPIFIKTNRLIAADLSGNVLCYFDYFWPSQTSCMLYQKRADLVKDEDANITSSNNYTAKATLYKHVVVLSIAYTIKATQAQITRNSTFIFLSNESRTMNNSYMGNIVNALSNGNAAMTYQGSVVGQLLDASSSYPEANETSQYGTSLKRMSNLDCFWTSKHNQFTMSGANCIYHIYDKDTIDISTGEIVKGTDLIENSTVTFVSDTVTPL